MPRQINSQVENNFIKGLITEATALNFPPNACTDTDNCIFHPKGDVYRRYGLDNEDGAVTADVTVAGSAVTTFTWNNPAGLAKSFHVVQVGRYLHFYNVPTNASVSSGKHATVLDLDAYKTSTTTLINQNRCQFASGQGYLFVVHPYCKPLYVKYNGGTDAITLNGIDVKVRDTEGVVDETNYDYDTRPTTLTDLHTYNLYNQGWMPTSTKDFIKVWRTDKVVQTIIPISVSPWYLVVNTVTTPARGDYPSNADVSWMFKNANDDFDIALCENNKRGNTPAPKGYFVMDAWNMDRTTASTITVGSEKAGGGLTNGSPPGTVVTLSGVPSTTSGIFRPSVVAFFAGRVWYTGVAQDNYSNKIFFSQVVKSPEQFGRCHQLNDPTNETLFDLLATDGGTIVIPDCSRIQKLFSIQNTLLVFATNGIWAISGNVGVGFTAGDYSIRKLSSIPCVSPTSFVDVEGLPYWWNYDGIYRISEINGAGGVKIDSLTHTTIRSFYKEVIPVNSKINSVGAYNFLTKEIKWLWSSTNPTSLDQRQQFDRVITFNTSSEAFFPWSFTTTNVKIMGIASLTTQGTSALPSGFGATPGGTAIVNPSSEGAATATTTLVTNTMGSVFKYLISYPVAGINKITFAEIKDPTHVDFKSYDSVGVDYSSYLTTGYRVTPGSAQKKFQSNYLTVFLRNLDNPQVVLTTSWDFGNAANSGRFSSPQTLMVPEKAEYDYMIRKVKVRGSGKALQLRFTSVSGKPFDLAGWSYFETVNSGV